MTVEEFAIKKISVSAWELVLLLGFAAALLGLRYPSPSSSTAATEAPPAAVSLSREP